MSSNFLLKSQSPKIFNPNVKSQTLVNKIPKESFENCQTIVRQQI